METFNRVFVFLFALVCIIVSRGVGVSLIWNMFVPQFFGLPNLPALIAVALSTLLATMMPSTVPRADKTLSAEESYKHLYKVLFIAFIAPWVGWLSAWISTSIYF